MRSVPLGNLAYFLSMEWPKLSAFYRYCSAQVSEDGVIPVACAFLTRADYLYEGTV